MSSHTLYGCALSSATGTIADYSPGASLKLLRACSNSPTIQPVTRDSFTAVLGIYHLLIRPLRQPVRIGLNRALQELAGQFKWLKADRRGNAFSKISSQVHFTGKFQNSDSEPDRIGRVGEHSVFLRKSRAIAGKGFLSGRTGL